jgi:putative inorganic carbon (HCO3(-)) transporter
VSEHAPRIRLAAVWLLAATAACLPLYVVRYRVGPLPTTLLEDLIGITVAAYALTLWAERRLPAARTAYDIPILLLLVAGVLGIVASPDHTRALGIYRAYFVEAILVFYVAVDLIRTPKELRTVLLAGAAGAAVLAAGQVVVFVIALAHHSVQIDNAPAFLNTSANAVALYLEPPLAFAIGFTLFPTSPKERWYAAALLSLLLVAMVLTLSRAGYAALALLAAVMILSVTNRRVRLGIVGGLAIALLAALELPFINQRLSTLNHSVQLRLSIYHQALTMLSQRPIFGAGISGFPIRVAPLRPASQEIELYPHNLWLTTWSEIGLLGVIAFGVIFFGLLWRGWRALGQARDIYKPVIWGSVGALVLYLVHGMFDSPYWKNDLSVEFWIVAALQVIAIRGARASTRSS